MFNSTLSKMASTTDNIIDVAFGQGTLIYLDASSYLWSSGSGTNLAIGDGTAISKSSPVAILCDRQYTRLVQGACAALDASSYAWIWGNGVYGQLGNNTSGCNYGQPQSVVGGWQWFSLVYFTNTFCGIDASSSYAWWWGQQASSVSSPASIPSANRQFIKMVAGYDHILALDSSSYVWAWGSNTYGQIGAGDIATHAYPTSVAINKQFVSIQAGQYTSYALDSSSYLWAWGYNSVGQLLDGTDSSKLNRSLPISCYGGPWNSFYIGGYNNAFGNITNQWYAWGDNTYYQYGNNTSVSADPSIPQLIAVTFPFKVNKFITTGWSLGTCAIDTQSNVWVWGKNTNGVLGVGNTDNISLPIRVFPRPNYNFYGPTPTTLTKIINNQTSTSGLGVSIFLDQSSYAWAWGGNTEGWLGNNTITNSSSPISVIGNLQFLNLAITKGFTASPPIGHTIGLNISSYAWAWGYNSYGQLGDNTTTFRSSPTGSFLPSWSENRSSPVSIVGAKRWLKVLAGPTHSIGIDLSSYVWCWGDNQYGQLGTNTITNISSPVSVVGNIQAIAIAVGNYFSALLNASSYIWSWGTNTGNLGDNTNINRSSPVSVVGGKQFIKITSNCSNTFWALDSSSYAWAWGSGSTYGELGNSSLANSSSPVSVFGAKKCIFIDGAPGNCVVLDSSSYAWTWGNNSSGQLGISSTASASSPVSIIGGYQWADINMGCSLIGVVSYPNSNILTCGTNSDNKFTNYNDNGSSIYTNSPLFVKFGGHSYIRPLNVLKKNILGK